MATTPFDPSHVGATAFDIYTDTSPGKSNAAQLSGGACHFVDLTPGANGARCGCRRFWTRASMGSFIPDQAGFCMCNHHVCFHDEGSREGPAQAPAPLPETNAQMPGQENEKPRTGREPLSPVMDLSTKMPPAVPGLDLPNFSPGGLSFLPDRPEDSGRQNARIPVSPQPTNSIPDTLSWGTFVQSQPDRDALPPIPPQCLLPSQATSTTSSVQARYLRPFAGKGLQTLSSVPGPKPRSSPQQKPKGMDSLTAIPEATGSSENSFVFVTPNESYPDTAQNGTPTQAEPRAMVSSSVSRRAFKNLSETVGGHEQRLDKLETMSFSVPEHEDCYERYDQTDLRITDLESRVDEVEKLVNDNGSVTSRRNANDDASVISTSTSMTSRPTHSQELYSQVQSLQAQVVHLQSMMPTISHPWEVEVVFLPFPLKKVWHEFHHFKTEPQVSNDDWTQLPMTLSTSTMRSQSPFNGDWANPDHEADWLLPKAFGDKGAIDRRLRSRGLIKTIAVKGSDARNVILAMNSAFGSVFREMQMYSRPQLNDPRISKFLGLQSPWVPLRKIHKDSRLRFLSPSEMLTPAMWNVQFLTSVMMRSSEPRLFVTHPDAYLQDYPAYETGWTWQRLKEANPGADVSPNAYGSDLHDDCWAWNEQLDEPPAMQSLTNERPDRQRVSISPSQQIRSYSSMMRSRRDSRPPNIRTTSVPVSAVPYISPGSSRRRLSHAPSRHPSPALRTASQSAVMKRRRTRSPSHARFTPRWTASPSPMPMGLSERHTGRGTTPFAYATPHSNAPYQEPRSVRGSSLMRQPPEYPSDSDVKLSETDSGDSYDDDDDESITNVEMTTPSRPVAARAPERRNHLPEDQPWPGIEDQDHLSDGENIDPRDRDDRSDISSQPSEYPSNERAWPADDAPTDGAVAGFHIHEDPEL